MCSVKAQALINTVNKKNHLLYLSSRHLSIQIKRLICTQPYLPSNINMLILKKCRYTVKKSVHPLEVCDLSTQHVPKINKKAIFMMKKTKYPAQKIKRSMRLNPGRQ
jgi:hypothetical protein